MLYSVCVFTPQNDKKQRQIVSVFLSGDVDVCVCWWQLEGLVGV